MIRSPAAAKSATASPAVVSKLFSPIKSGVPGATTGRWDLPSTKQGRVRIEGIGNGPGGASGGLGNNAARTGGAGGGPGQVLPSFDMSVADLLALFGSNLTGLYFDFGTPGLGAAAQTNNSSAGITGGTASPIVIRANDSSGVVIATINPGLPGQGAASGVIANGGASASTGVANGGASAMASGAQAFDAANNLFGASGAGAGGGLTAANAESNGSAGAKSMQNPLSTAAAVTTGKAGKAGNTAGNPFYGETPVPGLGGGGGASSASPTVPGGKGGDGAGYGAPGGGGGAGTDGGASGAGGDGKSGYLYFEWHP